MRGVFTGLIGATAALAAAQDGGQSGEGGGMISILAGVLVVAILVLGYLALRKPKAALPPSEIARGESRASRALIPGPRLVRIQGGVKVGADVPVNGTVVVGADPASTIRFEDEGLSPSHAEFRPDGGTVVVVDLQSTAGTFVNDVQIDPEVPHPLADGDKIRLGELVLQLRTSA